MEPGTSSGERHCKGAIFVLFMWRIWSEMASLSSVDDNTEEESIISFYFSRVYTYEVITEFVAKTKA